MGRDPRWFPDPLRFDPDRHLPENAASIPHFAYIPFGGGGRTCLGIRFALMEAVFIIAMIAQRFRLAPVPGSASGPKSVAFTLRPNGPLRVKLSPRYGHANTRFKPNSSRPFLCNTHKGISLCPHFG